MMHPLHSNTNPGCPPPCWRVACSVSHSFPPLCPFPPGAAWLLLQLSTSLLHAATTNTAQCLPGTNRLDLVPVKPSYLLLSRLPVRNPAAWLLHNDTGLGSRPALALLWRSLVMWPSATATHHAAPFIATRSMGRKFVCVSVCECVCSTTTDSLAPCGRISLSFSLCLSLTLIIQPAPFLSSSLSLPFFLCLLFWDSYTVSLSPSLTVSPAPYLSPDLFFSAEW